MNAIEVDSLVRDYRIAGKIFSKRKKKIRALNGISFNVKEGEIFGLVGPNGAGKTTTIKILITLLTPTEGTATVLGYNVINNPKEIRKKVGFMFGGERGLYYRLSGKDNLKYFAALYGLKRSYAIKRINELLELVGLSNDSERKVQTYSRGMKQRLHIARSLLHNPNIVFFDEPTVGLDPITAREIRKTIKDLSQKYRKTIFLTTHYMFEADELCDRVAILKSGKILKIDSPTKIKDLSKNLSVAEIEVIGVNNQYLTKILEIESVKSASIVDDEGKQRLTLYFDHDAKILPEIFHILKDIYIGKVSITEPTLEDSYVYLISQSNDVEVEE